MLMFVRSEVFWVAVAAVAAVGILLLTVIQMRINKGRSRGMYVEFLLFDKNTDAPLSNDEVEVLTERDRSLLVSVNGGFSIVRKDVPWISIRDKKSGKELHFQYIAEDTFSPIRLFIER